MSYNTIHVLARAVVLDHEHILLCKTVDRSTNFFFLPGGHIEPRESAEKAALRELLEESGFSFTIERFLGCLEYIFEPEGKHICHSHEYNMVFKAVSSKVRAGTEIPKIEAHIELQWVPLSELVSIDLRPEPLKQLISHWLKYDNQQVFQSKLE